MTANEPKTPETENALLDKALTEILRCLLKGENAEKTSRENGLMLSTAVDSINELLFDTFGDIAVNFDGNNFQIIEDYADELKEMFNI